MGYTLDANAVYMKATELCRILNDEGVILDKPPKWLQKQYSVPRPAIMPPDPPSDCLTSAQVRATRNAVAKKVLAPEGFEIGPSGTFWRLTGEQIHLIDFQPSKYGQEFTVNLGFHYAFIPGVHSHHFFRHKRFEHLLECNLRARIGGFPPYAGDTWFKYGKKREVLVETLNRIATECLVIFEKWSVILNDPEWWIDNLNAVGEFPDALRMPWDLGFERIWIAAIARRSGRDDLMSMQWERMKSLEQWATHSKSYECMWKEIVMRVSTPK